MFVDMFQLVIYFVFFATFLPKMNCFPTPTSNPEKTIAHKDQVPIADRNQGKISMLSTDLPKSVSNESIVEQEIKELDQSRNKDSILPLSAIEDKKTMNEKQYPQVDDIKSKNDEKTNDLKGKMNVTEEIIWNKSEENKTDNLKENKMSNIKENNVDNLEENQLKNNNLDGLKEIKSTLNENNFDTMKKGKIDLTEKNKATMIGKNEMDITDNTENKNNSTGDEKMFTNSEKQSSIKSGSSLPNLPSAISVQVNKSISHKPITDSDQPSIDKKVKNTNKDKTIDNSLNTGININVKLSTSKSTVQIGTYTEEYNDNEDTVYNENYEKSTKEYDGPKISSTAEKVFGETKKNDLSKSNIDTDEFLNDITPPRNSQFSNIEKLTDPAFDSTVYQSKSKIPDDIKAESGNFDVDFRESHDTHFPLYFSLVVIGIITCYVVFHNKQKIMAIIIEGRNQRRRRSRGGVSYKKLEVK